MSDILSPILSEESFKQKIITHVEPFLAKCQESLLKTTADDFDLSYSWIHSYSLTSRLLMIESVEFEEEFSLSVTLYKNQKKMTFSLQGFLWSTWEELLKKALFFLEKADPDKYLGLESTYDYKKTLPIVSEQFFPSTLSYQELAQKAVLLEKEGLNHPQIINSEGAELNLCYEREGRINSKGLNYKQDRSYYQASLALIAQKGNLLQQVESSYEGSLSDRLFSNLSPIGLCAQKRVLAKLDQRTVASGSYPVIFSPRVSSSLFQYLLSGLSGYSQYKKSSFLLDCLGQKVLPSWIDMIHQPTLSGAHYSTAVDSDGLEAKELMIVGSGEVEQYLLSLYSARRLGLEKNHLAGGAKNLFISSNAQDLEDILSSFDKAIVIDDLMGTGVNLINGDYSMGINGSFYEKKERLFALKEATIAGNLKNILSQITFHGADYLPYKNIRSGSTAIESMTLSSA